MSYEILLINVVRDNSGHSTCFNKSVGHQAIAAYLEQNDFFAKLFTGTVEECYEVINEELSCGNVSILGFYAAADNVQVVTNLIKWLKANHDVTTIVGGPQAMALDQHFFISTGNDFVIIGEGEIPTLLLLRYLVDNEGSLNQVPSIKYLDYAQKALVWNVCDDAVINDLDSIPVLTKEHILKYSGNKDHILGVITGRGCPYKCTFCYEGANAKNVRFRSIAHVMNEIDMALEDDPSLSVVNFYDDTFTLEPQRVLSFCEELKKRKLRWICEVHAQFVIKYPEIVNEMVRSGLICIQLGIESGSNRVLKAYNKKNTVEDLYECIKICKAAGIQSITGNIIVGGAFESMDTIEESKQLVKNIINGAKGMVEISTVYFAPYPKTKISENPQDYGIAISSDALEHSISSMCSPVVSTEVLTVSDIYEKKQEFEAYIHACCEEAVLNITKEEVLQGFSQGKPRIVLNPSWEALYRKVKYLENFLNHISDEEQSFSADRYIVRTLEDFVLESSCVITPIGKFYGLEKEVFLNASGKLTARELAQKLAVDLSEIEHVYKALNNRCLAYMSRW